MHTIPFRGWYKVFLLFFFLFSFSGSVFAKDTLAIVPFISRDEGKEYLGYLIRDLIKNALEKTGGVEIIDPLQVDEIIRESKTPSDVILVQTTAQVLGKRIGCNAILSGTFRMRTIGGKDRLIISGRLHQIGKEGYIDIKSNVFDLASPQVIQEYYIQEVANILGFISSGEPVSFPFPVPSLVPLYQGVAQMEEALREYGDSQFPNKPLWKSAFESVQQTISSEPTYIPSYYYLASMYQKTGWIAKEVETWNTYLELLKKEDGGRTDLVSATQAYLRLAYSYVTQKKYDLALNSLNDAIAIRPTFAEAFFLMGKVCYEQGDTGRAQEYWNKAYALNPSLKQAQYFASEAGKAATFGKDAYESYRTGYRFYSSGDLKNAAQYFRGAIKLNPTMKEAQYWLGRTLYDLGELDEAEGVWKKVIEIDPFDSQAKRFLEKTLQEKQYGRKALDAFRKGFELYQNADYQEAISYFGRAISENPRYPDAHDFLARSYYILGQKDKYIREREKNAELLSQPADKAWQYYQMGYELYSWGEKPRALDALKKAVDIQPDFPEAHLLLGELYGGMNDWVQAAEQYHTAQNGLEGEDKSSALWGVVVAYIKLDRWEDALQFLNELVTDYPYTDFIEEAESLRIEALVKQRKYPDARVSVQQFFLRFPKSTYREKVAFYSAFSFYQEKQWKESVKALESFVKTYPRSEYRRQVMEALGYTYRNLGEEEKSRDNFSQVEGGESLFLVGDTYYRQKEWVKALESFQKYIKDNPQGKYLLEARLKMASCFLENGQKSEATKAISGIENTLQEKFASDYLRLNIKLAYLNGEWQKVIDGISSLDRPDGRLEDEYLYLLIWSYVKLDKKDKAKELLVQAGKNPDDILQDPEVEELKNAVDLVQKEEYSRAIPVLKRMIERGVKPENTAMVDFLYGKSLYRTGDFSSASQFLQRAIQSGKADFLEEAQFYLGDIAYRQEKWPEVIQWYQSFSQKNDDTISWRLGFAYQKLGQKEQAIPFFQKIKSKPAFSEKATIMVM
ncbi:MAG: tetratricopeptide repeat protein [Candidatus Atribacteria bacterium]|nr:tetratricopeptide repeat protein [Candidatus Atribacteria bacterium]